MPTSSTISSPNAAPQPLKSPEEMNDTELMEFVTMVRSRRTSQQLANENKPQRAKKEPSSKASEATNTQKAKMLGDLMA